MNDKRIIENYKTVRAVEKAQPDPELAIKARDDLMRMIDHAIANPNPDAQPETRSLAEILSDIENDKNKSRTRKDFEIYMAQMAERLTHSKIARPVPSEQPEQANEPWPLFERIKFLRR